MDICDLLNKLNIGFSQDEEAGSKLQVAPMPVVPYVVPMLEDSFKFQVDVLSDHSRSNSPYSNSDPWGCAYVQAVRQQLDNFATTGGEYLETIFTHREIFSAYPEAHRQCARGFSDLAFMLERRAWRADRDADLEAITAFRHEAWAIAASL